MAEINGKSFRVGGVDYTVEVVPNLYHRYELFGQITYNDTHIQIEENLSEARSHEVLVHELLHGILFEAGYMEQDEELVRRVASVLHQVLRDNDFGFMRGDGDE